MEMLESKEQFRAVESTAFLVELLFALEVVEELSSVDESILSRSESEAWQDTSGTRTRAQGTTSAPTGS